ncbi:MAG: RNA-binding S4 domain-containing protein [Deltaproteobacteria bacterium]
MQGVRIDKWLWSIRFFKTRTSATESCKSGNIRNSKGLTLKASAEIKQGDEIYIRKAGIVFIIRAEKLISKRVSSDLAKLCYINLTPEAELRKFETLFLISRGTEYREKGSGRPTKKERRVIDEFKEYDFDDFDEYYEV